MVTYTAAQIKESNAGCPQVNARYYILQALITEYLFQFYIPLLIYNDRTLDLLPDNLI